MFFLHNLSIILLLPNQLNLTQLFFLPSSLVDKSKILIFCLTKSTFSSLAEMPTLIVAYQEYERHFLGIWGHFQGYKIFHQ